MLNITDSVLFWRYYLLKQPQSYPLPVVQDLWEATAGYFCAKA